MSGGARSSSDGARRKTSSARHPRSNRLAQGPCTARRAWTSNRLTFVCVWRMGSPMSWLADALDDEDRWRVEHVLARCRTVGVPAACSADVPDVALLLVEEGIALVAESDGRRNGATSCGGTGLRFAAVGHGRSTWKGGGTDPRPPQHSPSGRETSAAASQESAAGTGSARSTSARCGRGRSGSGKAQS